MCVRTGTALSRRYSVPPTDMVAQISLLTDTYNVRRHQFPERQLPPLITIEDALRLYERELERVLQHQRAAAVAAGNGSTCDGGVDDCGGWDDRTHCGRFAHRCSVLPPCHAVGTVLRAAAAVGEVDRAF